jgi:dTDP-4-amino-4,6-dideoxygalactose transaminase
VEKKRSIFSYYKKALEQLPGIVFMPEAPYGRCNRWLTVILIDPQSFGADREKIRLALEAENIESRPVWKPMHLQPVFQVAGIEIKDRNNHQTFPARSVRGEVAEDLFNRGLCLPSGTSMDTGDMDRVIEVIKRCCCNL